MNSNRWTKCHVEEKPEGNDKQEYGESNQDESLDEN